MSLQIGVSGLSESPEFPPLFQADIFQPLVNIEPKVIRPVSRSKVGNLVCEHFLGLLCVGKNCFQGFYNFQKAVSKSSELRFSSADANYHACPSFSFAIPNSLRLIEKDPNRIVIVESTITLGLGWHTESDWFEDNGAADVARAACHMEQFTGGSQLLL